VFCTSGLVNQTGRVNGQPYVASVSAVKVILNSYDPTRMPVHSNKISCDETGVKIQDRTSVGEVSENNKGTR